MNKAPFPEDTAPYRAIITGTGSFAPLKVLTNDDFTRMVDTSDDWITTRTGIKVRHIAADNESTATLATEAAKKALLDARLSAAELDLIIVATITPEMVFPSTACFVQRNLHATNAFAFDIAAACSGFVYALEIVHQFIAAGKYKNALVIGAETLSKITNYQDRTSCILFGDAAGAAVLQRAEDGRRGVIYSRLASDGRHWKALNCQAYGSRHPANRELDDPDKKYMQIQGREVYQLAVRRIVELVTDCLEHCGLTVDDIDMVVSHQMNARIIESAAKRLCLPDEKVFINITNYGNTSAASIPLAFDECRKQGRIRRGDVVILVAFGAGLTWGATIVEV
ncbi:MAG: beta-ketoacyl-ACP synthase III [Planctomycetota bacterium]